VLIPCIGSSQAMESETEVETDRDWSRDFLEKVCWGVAAVDLEDRSCGRKLVTL